MRSQNARFRWTTRIHRPAGVSVPEPITIAKVKAKQFLPVLTAIGSHDQCSCGEWAGEEAGGWISCTERISAPFALMPVALPFANAV